jgi:hypothetical protein
MQLLETIVLHTSRADDTILPLLNHQPSNTRAPIGPQRGLYHTSLSTV